MELGDTFLAMHQALRDERSVDEVAVDLGVDGQRLAAYRMFLRQHVISAMEKVYTSLPVVLGPELWRELSEGYYLDVPAADFELNACVAGFVECLEPALTTRGMSAERIEALRELATLEWLEFAVATSTETDDALPSEQAGDKAGGEREFGQALVVNPTLVVLQTHFAVGRALERFRQTGQVVWEEIEAEPETLLVYRDPRELTHRVIVARPEHLLPLTVAVQGLTVEEVAAQAGLTVARVHELLAAAEHHGFLEARST